MKAKRTSASGAMLAPRRGGGRGSVNPKGALEQLGELLTAVLETPSGQQGEEKRVCVRERSSIAPWWAGAV